MREEEKAEEITVEEILAQYQNMPEAEAQDEGDDLIKVEEA